MILPKVLYVAKLVTLRQPERMSSYHLSGAFKKLCLSEGVLLLLATRNGQKAIRTKYVQ